MALSRWLIFATPVIDLVRDTGGIYEFADGNGEVIYIGGSDRLARRLSEHLAEDRGSRLKRLARKYRYEYRADHATEAKRRLEAFVQEHGAPPACNANAARAG